MQAGVPSGDILTRFQRLMKDVRAANWQRTSFDAWEIELLLDIADCSSEFEQRRALLDRYQKAVERRLSNHCEMPMKLSEYIAGLRARHAARTEAQQPARPPYSPALS